MRGVERGLTLFDQPAEKAQADLAQWKPLVDWLEPILRVVHRPRSVAILPWSGHRRRCTSSAASLPPASARARRRAGAQFGRASSRRLVRLADSAPISPASVLNSARRERPRGVAFHRRCCAARFGNALEREVRHDHDRSSATFVTSGHTFPVLTGWLDRVSQTYAVFTLFSGRPTCSKQLSKRWPSRPHLPPRRPCPDDHRYRLRRPWHHHDLQPAISIARARSAATTITRTWQAQILTDFGLSGLTTSRRHRRERRP